MKKTIGIVGSGIVGLLIGYNFSKLGHKVTIFEKENKDNFKNCSMTAAGMLSPFCELIHSDKKIFDLGLDSIDRWKKIIKDLKKNIFFQTKGSLVVVEREHENELQSICHRTNEYAKSKFKVITNKKLRSLEPDVDSRNLIGLFFNKEGQIDTSQIMEELINFILKSGSMVNFGSKVKQIKNHQIFLSNNKKTKFDYVIECSGLDSLRDKKNIRGVRGEIIEVSAPEVNISRPIRLNHFRYPVYIAPRENNRYLIGATEIESEDFSPVSVRSAIELLNSSLVISKKFSEARITTLSRNCRPAYSDNLPKININKDYISANGLFRHGYLLSPIIAHLVVEYCLKDKKDKDLYYIYN